ncbi:hypothetical protein JOY44_15945 [Phormidium sp. CLA17]|uniref:HpsJ family protein n=1 Tax=Leptolyngbya sp. Cla-17 TaxID=2803751 RepID=UPI001491C514|nr:HpsJ family protein [Leptolyngbya sp. Cla-17]MBM0743081.1 hypothetical protein [Leptolyngbya sp. Cla-17]
MKATNSSPWTPLILKLIGALLLLTSLIDYLVLLSTAKFQDSQWVITFTTQVVDRGVFPLIGLALLFTGFWLEANSSDATRTAPWLRLTALVLSSLLGLFFLLIVPWNVVGTRDAVDAQMKQIGQEATKAESQIDAQIQQFRGQLDSQLAQIDQLISSGQLQDPQLAQAKQQQTQLKRLKSDPKAFDAEIAPKKTEELSKIKTRKQELESQTQGNALRSGLRTGLNSLLLAIGYIIIGWSGLRQML